MRKLFVGVLFIVSVAIIGCASDAERRWRENTGVESCGFRERMADALAATSASANHQNPQDAVRASQARHPWCS